MGSQRHVQVQTAIPCSRLPPGQAVSHPKAKRKIRLDNRVGKLRPELTEASAQQSDRNNHHYGNKGYDQAVLGHGLALFIISNYKHLSVLSPKSGVIISDGCSPTLLPVMNTRLQRFILSEVFPRAAT
jgi:hypothetical protein